MRVLPALAVVFVCGSLPAADSIPVGAGSFQFAPQSKKPHELLKVWSYRPTAVTKESRVVIVMHGTGRKGESYRDAWAPFSEKQNFWLVVPEFPEARYPSETYNQGNILDGQGKLVDPEEWTFPAIERLFDKVKDLTGSTTATYNLYGHSAGGQFVHRFVMFMPEARYDHAIAANPGFYTMPTADARYPYGLKGTHLKTVAPEVFTRNFTVLLGEADTDRNDPDLRKTPEADAQGLTRFERGKNYYQAAKQAAQASKAKFEWKVETVPGVGHSNTKMAPAAAKLLFK